jgi:hypothetical protein
LGHAVDLLRCVVRLPRRCGHTDNDRENEYRNGQNENDRKNEHRNGERCDDCGEHFEVR